MGKNGMQPMDANTYPDHWARESRTNEGQGLYAALAGIAPAGRTLEIGCGIGLGTLALARSRPVLSIDNNPKLIALTRQAIRDASVDAEVMEDDVFSLSLTTASQIATFAPDGIVCWFAGSHPDDVARRTSPALPPSERPKQYRENIEDRLVQAPLCGPTVKWVHLATRVGMATAASLDEAIEAIFNDYNSYMLKDSPFRVADVQVFDWEPGEMAYVFHSNPAFMGGQVAFKVISVLARRP
ncbi:class I SAM-dependent methyltransferase [Xanthomonas campestris]|uniref:class I SAM-dependent methyltransferase n=1 Tax=Xanthomonas campestris TaxID=339 RepID=UPI001C84368D|nr:class I SAM-dependent methyltransferase [Xanthomonas campestris]MCC5053896.1 class I SAM-dependent methyltransferase [Xanthomonas campestris pv. aberrans]MDM7685143.1 class I SAM-dependent methyltransferase [Xanthomonas campestris pv. campestris]MDM7689531.1 class I SAM-dependent methyltransferase [Xanthomonas campestris pv. campestris]MEB1128296.1 class I SAM-dependent methyltransferase [Xanthomonas campestris pv. campestris]